jgi:tRNA threonylcarbamoyladenosine biosynthesis protein TsaB
MNKNNYILYIDTVNSWTICELYFYDSIKLNKVCSFREKLPKEAGVRLSSEVKKILDFSNIKKPDLILVSNGPGSFTGIRIGVSFVRALSQGFEIPCVGINTIELYTYYYYSKFKKRSNIFLDGRMKKVYAGSYGENGFSGAFDLSLESALSTLDIKNSINISDMKLDGFFNINDDYPDSYEYILQNINKYIILDYNNNYKNLLPNYIRGTYVDGK